MRLIYQISVEKEFLASSWYSPHSDMHNLQLQMLEWTHQCFPLISLSSRATISFFQYFLIMCSYHCALCILADLVIIFHYDWPLALDHWASLQACQLFISVILVSRTGLDITSARNFMGYWIDRILLGFSIGSSTSTRHITGCSNRFYRSSTRTFLCGNHTTCTLAPQGIHLGSLLSHPFLLPIFHVYVILAITLTWSFLLAANL